MKEPLKKSSSSPTSRRAPMTVERRHGASVHDDSAHLWAVSYADFLMVLLCFFIIFFSTDDGKKESIIQKIFLGSQDGTQNKAESGHQNATQADTQNKQASAGGDTASRTVASKGKNFPDGIQSSLQGFSVSKSPDTTGLIVLLQDDLYEKGSYSIRGYREKLLADFMKQVLPYRDQISLTFIGHADGSSLSPSSKRKIFQDNFDLSAIRATRALQFAVRSGFPEEQLSAQGNSKNSRASRTLSILIRPIGDFL